LNRYVELKRAFQFLECATRQKDLLARCRDLPSFLVGRPAESTLRDYVFCLMLVSVVTQLEADLERLRHVPGLARTDRLATRLRLLRDHFQISADVFDPLDRLREARNQFVHTGDLRVDAGCTKADMPGIVVRFLQRCSHPDYL
jgi:hypothetical protein